MKILSMDLSLSCPAFAVMDVNNGVVEVQHLSHVKTKTSKPHGYRLFEIYNHLESIYKEHPDITEVVREKGFSRFPKTTQILFQVVGISTICSYKYGFEKVEEIAPTSVKKAITGNGKSTKEEVAKALNTVYGIDINFKTDDESDAIACGISFYIKKGLLS